METPKYAPQYFLIDPLTRAYRLTKRGREVLGPRFARQGIAIDALHTLDEWRSAINHITDAEYQALTRRERRNEKVLNQIYDLGFILDPFTGQAPIPLDQRRKQRDESILTICKTVGIDLF